MEVLFLVPIASSLPEKSSSVSDRASSVAVGDGAGSAGSFFLGFLAFGGFGDSQG